MTPAFASWSDFFAMGGYALYVWLAVAMSVIPLVVLVLLGVQELSLHAYWDNAVGLLTQFFYLPLLRLGAIVAMWTGQVFWFYFGAFLLLVLSSWLGCRAKDPVKK